MSRTDRVRGAVSNLAHRQGDFVEMLLNGFERPRPLLRMRRAVRALKRFKWHHSKSLRHWLSSNIESVPALPSPEKKRSLLQSAVRRIDRQRQGCLRPELHESCRDRGLVEPQSCPLAPSYIRLMLARCRMASRSSRRILASQSGVAVRHACKDWIIMHPIGMTQGRSPHDLWTKLR